MLNFVVNPKAGKGRGKRNMRAIIKHLTKEGETFKVVYSERAKEIPSLVKKMCDEGADNIIAVGGDGTVNEALNGIADLSATSFGIIPSGNGNDFANFLGISLNPLKALELIRTREPEYTDFIEIGESPDILRCMNIAGTGLDAEVLARCERSKFLKGKLQYIISLLQTIRKFQFFKFCARTDGTESTHNGFIAAICNGGQFGNGIKISPESNASDGKLNVILIEELPRKKIMWALRKKLLKGKVLELPQTKQFLADEVEIIPELPDGKPFFVQVDGELYENLKFKCRLVRDKLKMYR